MLGIGDIRGARSRILPKKGKLKMSMDFTVVSPVRHLFGDRDGAFPIEKSAPFVGRSKDFPFSCPKVIREQMAVLQFESFGVMPDVERRKRNIIRINGVDIAGGITSNQDPIHGLADIWKTNSLIVGANVLQEQNTLHIEAIFESSGGPFNIRDSFIIDNIVVFFKTHP